MSTAFSQWRSTMPKVRLSNAVEVTLADRSLPGEPTITSASGAGGKVVLTFAPAMPEERTAQFLVLRSGNAADQGVVLGDPLAGSVREYQDLYVSDGKYVLLSSGRG